jgi:hypothetical protein
VPLDGARLGPLAYIHLVNDPTIASVRFTLDNTWLRTTDTRAPWNMIEVLNLPLPLLTPLLRNGQHTVTALITFTDGHTVTTSATFTVRH